MVLLLTTLPPVFNNCMFSCQCHWLRCMQLLSDVRHPFHVTGYNVHYMCILYLSKKGPICNVESSPAPYSVIHIPFCDLLVLYIHVVQKAWYTCTVTLLTTLTLSHHHILPSPSHPWSMIIVHIQYKYMYNIMYM